MSAPICEKCGAEAKTYWVGDKEWLCGPCFKRGKSIGRLVKTEDLPQSLRHLVSGLQLEDEEFDGN